MEVNSGYIRVSTDNQIGEDRFGIAAQREAIEAFCAASGTKIDKWYYDEGVSGAKMDRPGLQELLADASNGQVKALVVAKMDRIARDLMAQLWIEKELLKHGVEIISAGEPFRGQDPANVLFRQIIGAFAQFEKSRISERMSGGRRQKAKRGGYAGGRAAFGYKAKKGSKRLELDPEKAVTVRRVFEIKAEVPKASLQFIADKLNGEGHTTAMGKEFTRVQVKRILEREDLYKGDYTYAGIIAPGRHIAII